MSYIFGESTGNYLTFGLLTRLFYSLGFGNEKCLLLYYVYTISLCEPFGVPLLLQCKTADVAVSPT